MFVQMALLAAQLWLGEITRQRPKRTNFEDFLKDNAPSEIRPIPYGGGTFTLTPSRQWFGDFSQRAVERDSHWTDYLWAGALAFLLDTITVAYRSYVGEMFPLCWGETHVEQIFIQDRLMFQATPGTDNSGGRILIDDPQAWGGDQPPGEGGEYAFIDITRGDYMSGANAYLESLLTTPPNKTPALHGIATLVKLGRSGATESGYFHAGGVGVIPRLKEWRVVCRRQPDNLATGFNKIGRHMNPMEVIYEWSTSLEYGARCPLAELNLSNWQQVAEDLYNEENGWSGTIETSGVAPQQVVQDVLDQIDAVAQPSPSLGLTIRLIRRDYSFASLRILNRDVITQVNRFTAGTYEDTKNKVQVEFPDQDNNFKGRKALYIDTANQLIQDGRTVPQTQTFNGISDFAQANEAATRQGRALGLPRASLDCNAFPSWGRLSYIGEVVLFEWESPSFSIVMRVLSITPNGPDEQDYKLVLVEDQFSTGLRTFGESGETEHVDPGGELDTAPPSATLDSLTLSLTLTNTNQFVPAITGVVTFGSYSGGQYGRIYVTEPGGMQTLSPIQLAPDGSNEATFTWPANAVGTYEFCVQTYSWRGATNGVKVCDSIVMSAIGSPSVSQSASVSPSSSQSPSVSPSASASPSSSLSPSASQSQSASVSPSHSASASTSPSSSVSLSLSPSASLSPSSSSSPSVDPGPPVSGMDYWIDAGQETGYSDEDTVNPIQDWSGNNNDISQSTSTQRAKWDAGMSNGRAAFKFDGIDDFMDLPVSVSDDSWTLYVVLRPQQSNNTSSKTIVGPSLTSGVQIRLSPNTHKVQFVLSATSVLAESNANLSASVFTLLVIARDTSDLLIRINGSLDNDLGAFTQMNSFGRLAYANTGGFVEPYEGWITELLLYPTKHNSTEISDTESWLLNKHNL